MNQVKKIFDAIPIATEAFAEFAETVWNVIFSPLKDLITFSEWGFIMDNALLEALTLPIRVIIEALMTTIFGNLSIFEMALGAGIVTFTFMLLINWVR